MKQRIRLSEGQLNRIIKESVRQMLMGNSHKHLTSKSNLNESYNDSNTVNKIEVLRDYVVSFIEYLDDKYDNLGSDTDFLDRVYNSANKLESDLQSFLYDNYQQSKYGY